MFMSGQQKPDSLDRLVTDRLVHNFTLRWSCCKLNPLWAAWYVKHMFLAGILLSIARVTKDYLHSWWGIHAIHSSGKKKRIIRNRSVFDIQLFNKVCPSVNKQDLQEKQIMYIWSASRWPKLVFFFNETHKKFKSIHLWETFSHTVHQTC